MTPSEISGNIWQTAELLRDDYRPHEYGDVILPMTLLRRLDCILAGTKDDVLKKYDSIKNSGIENIDPILNLAAKEDFHNHSQFDFQTLLESPSQILANAQAYLRSFSGNVKEIFEKLEFAKELERLEEANLLLKVFKQYQGFDISPKNVSELDVGYIFEDLIRRFSEAKNEDAGHFFTPKEVVRLMVSLLFSVDSDDFSTKGIIRNIYDPACGTGGMLSEAENQFRKWNPDATVNLHGQELYGETYALCRADMLMRGQSRSKIVHGNSLSDDGFAGEQFEYMLSNPPYGTDWKKVKESVTHEHEELGYGGRFGPGLPRTSDGSLLFVLNMIKKMVATENGGSRIAVILNGSPLFTGGAGSGESEIRRYILENDLLETIIALPDHLFYNTPIHTYIWIITNVKPEKRRGKVQLINAVDMYQKMSRSLGDKRNELSQDHISEIVQTYGNFAENGNSKIFDNSDFGYHKVTVERPLRAYYRITEDALERLQQDNTFRKLAESKKKGEKAEAEIAAGEQLQADLLAMLEAMQGEQWDNQTAFDKALKKAAKAADLKLASPVRKAILSVCEDKDADAPISKDSKGQTIYDTDLRDTETIPLKTDIEAYFEAEVLPHVPDAVMDRRKDKVGYEINFTRYFYEFKPLRPLEDIAADIRALESETAGMLGRIIEG